MRTYLRFVSLSMLGMLGLSVYILADTLFIARFIGADALAALNLALPVYAIINGTGLLIGIGGATRYTLSESRAPGSGSPVFVAALALCVGFSILFCTVGAFFVEPLTGLLGASGSVFEPTAIYVRITLLFSPLFLLNNTLVAFTRADGAPGRAMAAMLLGSGANILMDALFVVGFSMGMFGAVLATGMSPIFGISLCLLRRRGFHPVRSSRAISELPRVAVSGLSAFIGELASAVALFTFNFLLLSISGNTGVAAYGIVANIALVAVALLNGAAQGAQPLFSHAWAQSDFAAVKTLLRRSIVTAVLLGGFFTLCACLFPMQAAGIFAGNNNTLTAAAASGLTLYFLCFPFAGVNLLLSAFGAAVEKPHRAALLSLLRSVLLLVPFAVFGAHTFGITGLWLCVPAAEAVTLLLMLPGFLRHEKRPSKTESLS